MTSGSCLSMLCTTAAIRSTRAGLMYSTDTSRRSDIVPPQASVRSGMSYCSRNVMARTDGCSTMVSEPHVLEHQQLSHKHFIHSSSLTAMVSSNRSSSAIVVAATSVRRHRALNIDRSCHTKILPLWTKSVNSSLYVINCTTAPAAHTTADVGTTSQYRTGRQCEQHLAQQAVDIRRVLADVTALPREREQQVVKRYVLCEHRHAMVPRCLRRLCVAVARRCLSLTDIASTSRLKHHHSTKRKRIDDNRLPRPTTGTRGTESQTPASPACQWVMSPPLTLQ
jgi:hypothetical protein